MEQERKMTEEKLNKANKLKQQIKNLEKALESRIEGLFYENKEYRVKYYIDLDVKTINDIKTLIKQRLEELRKAFEEL